MTAKEAKKISDVNCIGTPAWLNKHVDEALANIAREAENGKYSWLCMVGLHDEVQGELIKKGYKIIHHEFSTISIYWNNV